MVVTIITITMAKAIEYLPTSHVLIVPAIIEC